MIKGYDISAIQGSVDFKQLYANGIEFIVFRCYVGNDFKDPNYDKNVVAAKNAGLMVMCYHFAYPLPTDPAHPNRDPISQAQLHFNASGGEIACLDLEWPLPKDWKSHGVDAVFIKQWALAYLQEYERLSGNKPIIYTYPDFCNNVQFSQEFAQYKLWIASYQSSPQIPKPWTSYVMWQNGQGTLPNGVIVDTDLMNDLRDVWGMDPPIAQAPVITPQPIVNVAPVSVPVIQSPKSTQPAPTPSTNFNVDEIEKIGGNIATDMVKSSPLMLLVNSVIGIIKKIFKIT